MLPLLPEELPLLEDPELDDCEPDLLLPLLDPDMELRSAGASSGFAATKFAISVGRRHVGRFTVISTGPHNAPAGQHSLELGQHTPPANRQALVCAPIPHICPDPEPEPNELEPDRLLLLLLPLFDPLRDPERDELPERLPLEDEEPEELPFTCTKRGRK